ncbi:hypothetical protein CJ030_MR1G018584 [Morella rubra]|uniref:Uncharacterized protein n=1 Tax=Morella rubra TaxID=262757 RepID=A0A6A1WLA5_9ROSI|nr:hypothetical protein CJ030_MR1G018584 [Morella rubra]
MSHSASELGGPELAELGGHSFDVGGPSFEVGGPSSRSYEDTEAADLEAEDEGLDGLFVTPPPSPNGKDDGVEAGKDDGYMSDMIPSTLLVSPPHSDDDVAGPSRCAPEFVELTWEGMTKWEHQTKLIKNGNTAPNQAKKETKKPKRKWRSRVLPSPMTMGCRKLKAKAEFKGEKSEGLGQRGRMLSRGAEFVREMGKIDLTLTEGRFVNLGGVDARETHVHEKRLISR